MCHEANQRRVPLWGINNLLHSTQSQHPLDVLRWTMAHVCGVNIPSTGMGRTHQDIVEEEEEEEEEEEKRKRKGRRNHTWVNHPKLFGRCTCTSSYQFMFHAGEG